MSLTLFAQLFFNVVVLILIFVAFARLRRPAKDDPRMSKGLQLLSSKIAVLEDLNDRTESQVQQMLTLLDQKSRELQQKIVNAEAQVQQIRQSMSQSLEVAQIFQDKIPHTEIIERQTSMKYVRAARLAHQGKSVDEISLEVDLPRGEIEFIAKVNREQLSFREEDLPAWARDPHVTAVGAVAAPSAPVPSPELAPEDKEIVERLNRLQFEMKNLDLELAGRQPTNPAANSTNFGGSFVPTQLNADSDPMAELGKQFRQAVNHQANASPLNLPISTNSQTLQPAPAAIDEALIAARSAAVGLRHGELQAGVSGKAPAAANPSSIIGKPPSAIKRVEFPRI